MGNALYNGVTLGGMAHTHMCLTMPLHMCFQLITVYMYSCMRLCQGANAHLFRTYSGCSISDKSGRNCSHELHHSCATHYIKTHVGINDWLTHGTHLMCVITLHMWFGRAPHTYISTTNKRQIVRVHGNLSQTFVAVSSAGHVLCTNLLL